MGTNMKCVLPVEIYYKNCFKRKSEYNKEEIESVVIKGNKIEEHVYEYIKKINENSHN